MSVTFGPAGARPGGRAAVAAATGQVGIGLDDEHETNKIFLRHIFYERAPQGDDARRVAFGGMNALFLRSQPSPVTACPMAD